MGSIMSLGEDVRYEVNWPWNCPNRGGALVLRTVCEIMRRRSLHRVVGSVYRSPQYR